MDQALTISMLRERRRRKPAAMVAGIAMALSLSTVLQVGARSSGGASPDLPAAAPIFTPYLTPTSTGALVSPPAATAAHTRPAVASQEWTLAAAHYLKSRWNLADAYARRVTTGIARASSMYHVDPMLLLAIAATESSFQHDVGNPGGGNDPLKPYGIMQVAGEFHRDKFPGGQVGPTTVEQNINLGASVLRDYLNAENGNVRLALRRYGGTDDDRYYQRVNHFNTLFHRELAGNVLKS
jgi:soluble lytic murein transglycosylase-like protein